MKKRNQTAVIVLAALFLLVAMCLPVFADSYGGSSGGDLDVTPTTTKPVEKTSNLNISAPDNEQGGGSGSGDAVAPSETVQLSGGGFAPKAKYDILWDGKVILDPYADTKGYVSYKFTIPANATPGIHTVSMRGAAADGGILVLSGNVEVAGVVTANNGAGDKATKNQTGSAFPFTGGDLLLTVLFAGVLLISLGFGLKLRKRAR